MYMYELGSTIVVQDSAYKRRQHLKLVKLIDIDINYNKIQVYGIYKGSGYSKPSKSGFQTRENNVRTVAGFYTNKLSSRNTTEQKLCKEQDHKISTTFPKHIKFTIFVQQ